MRRMLPLFLVAALLAAAGCGSSSDLSRSETQKQFGVRMAKMNLWREAMFRFRRAAQIDPNDAMAHNNLAVALEANGEFESAALEYREAMRLDRSNQYIQKNYSRLVEFMQRSKKRAEPATAATSTAPAEATPAGDNAPAVHGGTQPAGTPTPSPVPPTSGLEPPPAEPEPVPPAFEPPPTGATPPTTAPPPAEPAPLPPTTPPPTDTAPPPPPELSRGGVA